jgi:hypothetical protein
LRKIEEGNAKAIREGSSIRLRLNDFADISPEEWKRMSQGVPAP